MEYYSFCVQKTNTSFCVHITVQIMGNSCALFSTSLFIIMRTKHKNETELLMKLGEVTDNWH